MIKLVDQLGFVERDIAPIAAGRGWVSGGEIEVEVTATIVP